MKDKVVLIFRKPIANQYSIELLFAQFKFVDHYILKGDFRSPWTVLMECLKLRREYSRFHITGDVHWVHIFLIGKSVSHTYHDFNHYENLFGTKKYIYFLLWIFIPLVLSKRIIFISPYTASKNPFKILIKKKTDIIPNAVRLPSLNTVQNVQKDILSKVVILAFNTSENKNVSTLLMALNVLCEWSIELRIIGQEVSTGIMSHIKVSYYKDISDDELVSLYQESNVLWFASIKEGFGMPILEAQAHGLPVITTRGSAMTWVGGDGAYYVNDPLDLKEIETTLRTLIENTSLRNELVINGARNFQRFSYRQFEKSYMSLLYGGE